MSKYPTEGAKINVEECDSSPYTSVAARPGSARARTGSLSTTTGNTSSSQAAPSASMPLPDAQVQQPQAQAAAYPKESDVTVHEVRPEDGAASTGGGGRRNSPLPSNTAGLPRPPSAPQQGLTTAAGEGSAEQRTPLLQGHSITASHVAEQDVTINGVTPCKEDKQEEYSPRSIDSDAPAAALDEKAPDVPSTTAASPRRPPGIVDTPKPASPESVSSIGRPPRSATAATAAPPPCAVESRSSTSGTNDGAHLGKPAGAAGIVAGAGGSRNVKAFPERPRETSGGGGDGRVDQYEDLDQNPESDVESDDESFKAAKPAYASCCVDRSDPDGWRYAKPRKTGMERPFHANQLAAFAILIFGEAFFYSGTVGGLALLYRDGYKCLPELICAIAIGAVASLVFVITWIILTFYDPGDYDGVGDMCTYCARRTSKTSKHCKWCNKCVADFDHHCKWLNMCVGGKNYRLFLVYVSSGVVLTMFFVAMSVADLAKWWHDLSQYNVYFRVGPILAAVVVILPMGPLIHLLNFHIMLNIRGMTTYEHILWKRDKKLKRSAQNPKKKQRRLFFLSKKTKEEKVDLAQQEKDQAAAAAAAAARKVQGSISPEQGASGNQLEQELAKAAAALRGL